MDEESKRYKIKQHFIENKKFYIGTGCGFVFAGITCSVIRGRSVEIPRVSNGSDVITTRPFSFFSKQNVVTVIKREGRGHPGYRVRCLETGAEFMSQGEAARELGAYPSVISGHLNGKLPNVHGLHLERILAE